MHANFLSLMKANLIFHSSKLSIFSSSKMDPTLAYKLTFILWWSMVKFQLLLVLCNGASRSSMI